MSLVDQEALGARRTLTQADFDRFAQLSGDDNPIHVDPAFAARTRFGRTVAHGALLVSLLTALLQRRRPGWRLLGQEIRFPAPTFAGEEVELQARPLRPDGGPGEAYECRTLRTADGVVTCDGVLRIGPDPEEEE